MLTGVQIRAARAALKWSAARLAEEVGVAHKTIARFEEVDGIPRSRTSTLAEVRYKLEAAGIEFIEDDGRRGPGVRLALSNRPMQTG
jgi:transcriptional regulator with XRE-family HTH domain